MLTDSSALAAQGETCAKSRAFPLGPSAPRSNVVSLLLRYGTCDARCCSADTTSPKALSDLLMCRASNRRSPDASERATRSEPARSTRNKAPRVFTFVSRDTASTRTITTECDRLERAFIAVAPVERFASPSRIAAYTSSASRTTRATASGTLSAPATVFVFVRDPFDPDAFRGSAPNPETSILRPPLFASKSRHSSL